MPHTRIQRKDHVAVKGTIWLGRLDEVDMVVFSNDTLMEHPGHFDVIWPSKNTLSSPKTPRIVRLSLEYFSGHVSQLIVISLLNKSMVNLNLP